MPLILFRTLCGLSLLLYLACIADAEIGVMDVNFNSIQVHHFKRSLPLELEARQCRVATCPNGGCAPSLSSVCCPAGGYCDSGERCCGTRNCAPSRATCCPNGNYALPGEFCCPVRGSCPLGTTCDGDYCRTGTGATGTGQTSGSSPTSARNPPPQSTTEVTVWRWYYFTITWYYYTWYYSYNVVLGATDVFSSTIYSTTTLSISTSDSAAASAWFTSLSRTISLPTPASATPLPRPTSSVRIPSSITTPDIPSATAIPTPSASTSTSFSAPVRPTSSSTTLPPGTTPGSSSQPAAATTFAQVSANVAGRLGVHQYGERGFGFGFLFSIGGLLIIPGLLMHWL